MKPRCAPGPSSSGIQTPIKFSLAAICQDIGSRSRTAVRDRAHLEDRRALVYPGGCRLVPRARTDGRWAESTPTSSSSKLNRIGRKGAQIWWRARSPYLTSSGPGRSAPWEGLVSIGKRTNKPVIVQPGIRLHEGSATAARLFAERSDRNRERERGGGLGAETGALAPPPKGWQPGQTR